MANLAKSQGLMIERKIESQQIKQEHREHIGASVLGNPCSREIWYAFRWTKDRYVTPRMNRLFNRGHMEEIVVIEDLVKAGCKVIGMAIDQSIIDRFKTVFNIDLPVIKQKQATFAYGFGGASNDGNIFKLADSPKTEHLLEVKTSKTDKFNTMKLNGLEKANYQHFVQVQIYMHLFGLKRCLYIMVCKENDDRHYERINYQPRVAKKYIKKAEYIATSETPPPRIKNDRTFYRCKWCDYSDICYDQSQPARNCRTCKNVLFDCNKGKVVCMQKGSIIKYKRQCKGCKKYTLDTIIMSQT